MIPELNKQLTQQVLSNAVHEAIGAFWASIASSYPSIKTGDLDPGSVVRFEELAERTVKTWLDFNAPGGVLPDNPDSLFAERVAASRGAFNRYDFSSHPGAPVRLGSEWGELPGDCVVNKCRDAHGAEIDLKVEFCPGTISISSVAASLPNGAAVGCDTAPRGFAVRSPQGVEVSGASFAVAHEVKWNMIGLGVSVDVVDAEGRVIPEAGPVLAAQDRLSKILADLVSQGRDFHLDDDPFTVVTAHGSGDEGRIFDDEEAAFLRKELAAIREVLDEDQLWDTASPFLGLGTEDLDPSYGNGPGF